VETFWKNFMTAWQRRTGQHFSKPLRDTILDVSTIPSGKMMLRSVAADLWRR